jgi:acyl dehydratase
MLAIAVGQRASRSLTITPEMVRQTAEITGDWNPLHFDEAFAARTKFGRLIAHGGLITGITHALVAQDLPGPGTVFMSQQWKFLAPVFIGDTITAEGEVLSVHETKPVTQMAMTVKRSDGTIVLEGEVWCYTIS